MKRSMILGIAVVTLIVISAAGAGYAAYMSNTYSEDNTMDVVVKSVDIYEGSTPIDKPMTMPEFVRNGSATISGYTVATTGEGNICLQCLMKNGAYWPLIKSMTLGIGEGDAAGSYAFGIDRDLIPPQSDLPTDWIGMDPDQTFTYGGKTLLYYDFTITIEFTDIDITDDPDYEKLITFEGAEFTFYYAPSNS